MFRQKLLIFGALLTLLGSCGGGNSSGPASVTLPPHERSESVVTNSSIDEILTRSHLECSDSQGNCPKGLALLVGLDNGKSYRCSAFVLENGLVYTNSHCLPEKLSGASGVSCRDSVGLVFNIDGQMKRVNCETLVKSTPLESRGIQDVAVLKVSLPDGVKPFKSDLRSRYSGERVKILKVDPKGDWNGEVSEVSCSLKMNTFFGEFFDGPQSPALNTLGCETMGGNSGSPIIDKNGFVLGVHQASLKEKSDLGLRIAGHFKSRSFSTLGTGTNLSCLCRDFGINQSCSSLPSTCQDVGYTGSDRRRSNLIESAVKSARGDQAVKILNTMTSGLINSLHWEVAYGHRLLRDQSENALRVNLMVTPKCISSPRDFERSLEASPSDIRETTHQIEVEAPYCKVNFSFNGLFDFDQIGIDKGSCQNSRMILYLRQVNGEWEGESQFIDANISSDDRPYAFNFKLPFCR